MFKISRYLKDNFDLEATIIPLHQKELERVPLYLRGTYRFFTGNIFDQKVVWAEPLTNQPISPDQLYSQAKQIRQFLDGCVVIILNNIESWQRQRLIKKKISFVQPSKQLYVPELLLQLTILNKNVIKKESTPSNTLSIPAQVILLYHFQVASIEMFSFQTIAEFINYSAMSVTRAMKELLKHGLVVIKGSKEKSVVFNKEKKELWVQIRPMLSSPVMETWYASSITGGKNYLNAGETALSSYSMLAEPEQKIIAIGKDEFRLLKKKQVFKDLNNRWGEIKIEVWRYDPQLLSKEIKVDRLSLYLSLKNEDDERIRISLEEMINQIRW